MKRSICMISLLLIAAMLLTGCGLKLPRIPYITSDPIVCLVTAKEDHLLTLKVQQEDRHYDEGDTIYLTYQTIANGTAVEVGDQITFEYDYMNKVTVMNKDAYIEVDTVTLTEWEPTETTEETK